MERSCLRGQSVGIMCASGWKIGKFVLLVIGDSFICKNCKKPRHSSRDCPQPKPCHNCKNTGHEAADCTEPRNMTRVNCRNCGGIGYFARGCPTLRSPSARDARSYRINCYKTWSYRSIACLRFKSNRVLYRYYGLKS
jgi:hypothetical protein